ncbi:MAG: DNA repair protein RecN [Proteobacteria bacterium]|nr:DNA repair protein RecN [Pseudomonadota bacterium]
MLIELSIRDFVLIDRLDLAPAAGLCVLTGETGAGKSILLDALGLALGARAESRLVRPGAASATVSAGFAVAGDHPARALIAAAGMEDEDALVLRRTLGADGRTRAFINDQPVSVNLLRQVGDSLVEIQGQFDERGLLDASTHRGLLDAFAGLLEDAKAVAARHAAWRMSDAALAEAKAEAEKAAAEAASLRQSVSELEGLAPKPGEEAGLVARRSMLMHAEKLVEAINAALEDLAGERGAERALGSAQRSLARVAALAAGLLDPAAAGLERAMAELAEALRLLQRAGSGIDLDSGRLAEIDDRLFALRDQARKHGIGVDALAARADSLKQRLAHLEASDARLKTLAAEAVGARTHYCSVAESLSAARLAAARRLDKRVAGELPPLKLERARFRTRIERLGEPDWGPAGIERIVFEVSTNPGSEPGPLAKVASGGELARFMLALKVVLAAAAPVPTLIFDEVDAGVGGAVADAVGERLARLASELQVLVVTHSPQVTARAQHHWLVTKELVGRAALTRVAPLDEAERREELARMLSGATVTDAARAAASDLMAGGRR